MIEVEKSRSGRSGTHLILGQTEDLDFYIADFTPEMDPDSNAPSSVQGRVLSRLRTAYPETRTKTDLIADRLIGGSPAAIKKTLQRLEAQQLIISSVSKGSRTKNYKANLARGEGWNVSPLREEASDGAAFGTGQTGWGHAFMSPSDGWCG